MISREQFVERAIPNPTEQHLSLVVFVTFVLFAVVSVTFRWSPLILVRTAYGLTRSTVV